MRKITRKLFVGFLLFLVALIGATFFLSIHFAGRYSRLSEEAVLKLKASIGPDQKKKILDSVTPLLGLPPKLSKPRVVVLGIDGLDHQYLDPLLREGKLPNFKRLTEEGAKGILLSIAPPSSAGAWPAMVTGCGPGKSHLLNFRMYEASSRKIVLTDGRDLRRPALWDILGLYGKKSVVINEPMSYPPHQIRRVMISGLLAPEGRTYTYPAALSPLLDEIGYKREAVPKGEGFFAPPSTLLSDLLLTEQKRLEVALLLMDETDWDFFFCMFPGVDRMMHHLGASFSSRDLEKMLLEMDDVLGDFLKHLPKGSTLLVVSDHGFTFYPKQFSVPAWLEQEGYWVLPQAKKRKDTPFWRMMRLLKRVEGRMNIQDIPGIRWPHPLQNDEVTPPVDWDRTSAISVEAGGNWGSIRLLKNKEILEEEMSEKLLRLTDPKTGQHLVRRVEKGKDFFEGPYQDDMPDLLFELSKARADFAFSDTVLREEATYHHRREGILFGWGKEIQKGIQLPPSQIVDVTPTLLVLLGVPVSEELDGKIIEALFERSSFLSEGSHRISRYPTAAIEWVGVAAPRGESSQDVKADLRSLGYLQ